MDVSNACQQGAIIRVVEEGKIRLTVRLYDFCVMST